MNKGKTIRVTLPNRISDIVEKTVKIGIFSSNSELCKTAILEYLDKMHLLDQVKSSIESEPMDD